MTFIQEISLFESAQVSTGLNCPSAPVCQGNPHVLESNSENKQINHFEPVSQDGTTY